MSQDLQKNACQVIERMSRSSPCVGVRTEVDDLTPHAPLFAFVMMAGGDGRTQRTGTASRMARFGCKPEWHGTSCPWRSFSLPLVVPDGILYKGPECRSHRRSCITASHRSCGTRPSGRNTTIERSTLRRNYDVRLRKRVVQARRESVSFARDEVREEEGDQATTSSSWLPY